MPPAIFRIRTSSTIFKNYKGSPVPSILLEGALKGAFTST
jgi:hypothetical protein